MPKKNLGRQLREAREAVGMDQNEIADALGVKGGNRTISAWETGANEPGPAYQRIIEAFYGWPPGTMSYAIETGTLLPAPAKKFERPSPIAAEAARRAQEEAAQRVAETLEQHSVALAENSDSLQQLIERMTTLEGQVKRLQSSRTRAAR